MGVSEARVSQLVSERVIVRGDTGHSWLLGYCERLRDQAAGRASSELGGLNLVQERAGLAREQRMAQALKNAVARGEYAPIGALADVLALASSAIVDRMDQIEGQLRKACPDLPDKARVTVLRVLADSRNEWIRVTSKLVGEHVAAMAQSPDEDETDLESQS